MCFVFTYVVYIHVSNALSQAASYVSKDGAKSVVLVCGTSGFLKSVWAFAQCHHFTCVFHVLSQCVCNL